MTELRAVAAIFREIADLADQLADMDELMEAGEGDEKKQHELVGRYMLKLLELNQAMERNSVLN